MCRSVADIPPPEMPLITSRSSGAPNRTISRAGLVGGGRIPQSGEILRVNRGNLFMGELPEFEARAFEVLRQPLENKTVSVNFTNSRSRGL